MPTNTFPIVGMKFRPPALALVDALAIDTPLLLIAEPDNNYDPNAIMVWLDAKDLSDEAKAKLEEELPRFGTDLASVIAMGQHHIGYIPREMAAQLKECGAVTNDEPVEVTFSTSSTGAPRVKFAEAPY
jgi:hypothetical protein